MVRLTKQRSIPICSLLPCPTWKSTWVLRNAKNKPDLISKNLLPKRVLANLKSLGYFPMSVCLPKQHHDLNRLGSNAAEELVRLSKDKEEFVIAAVKRLIEDQRFTQNQAIAFVKASNRKRGEISSEEEHVIHSGKSLFCSVRNRDGILTVRFKNPAIASEWKTKIVQFIQDTLKG